MKLYFSPGACSMAPHIVAHELGLDIQIEQVDLRAKKTKTGEDYLTINPKGYVPALRLDNGEVLTEAAVILQYLADQKPGTTLTAKAETLERYRLQEWLNFVAAEVHKTLGALFNPNVTPEWRENQVNLLGRRLDYVVAQLGTKPYLMGDRFTIADAYLYTVLNWHDILKVDLGRWPVIGEYLARIAGRASVKETLKAEGLAK